MPDVHQAQVIPENLGGVASAVIREEFSEVLNRHWIQTGKIVTVVYHFEIRKSQIHD